ncbi:hypothetical protein B5F10_02765 [Anaerotruncus colihominis]|uniref:Uncharacterized protein n=1 Tax=Anaerotruncus colihominis TaxID=169435 RepID=A0A1Y4N7P1_9FIRM|nr:hypothetical protein [Anaerotruncus colihominis]OUP70583.1 hypothetical protein B5F11_03855 [Anaerotruncus colihominis]OUP76081.1 hypothetical protein B5F10_02765 [Anaerotruncus colihominis]
MKYVLENIADAFTLENWSNLDMIWLVILATAFAVFLCTKVKLIVKVLVTVLLVLIALTYFGIIPSTL